MFLNNHRDYYFVGKPRILLYLIFSQRGSSKRRNFYLLNGTLLWRIKKIFKTITQEYELELTRK